MNDRFRMPAASWLTSNPEHAVPIAGLLPRYPPHLLNLGLCTAIETIRMIGLCKNGDYLKPSGIKRKYNNTVTSYEEDDPMSGSVQIDIDTTRLSIGLLDEWMWRTGVKRRKERLA